MRSSFNSIACLPQPTGLPRLVLCVGNEWVAARKRVGRCSDADVELVRGHFPSGSLLGIRMCRRRAGAGPFPSQLAYADDQATAMTTGAM